MVRRLPVHETIGPETSLRSPHLRLSARAPTRVGKTTLLLCVPVRVPMGAPTDPTGLGETLRE